MISLYLDFILTVNYPKSYVLNKNCRFESMQLVTILYLEKSGRTAILNKKK